MLETPHVAVGAVLAAKIGNPLLAIPIAFASHFVLETIPHWNPHLNTETKKFGAPTKRSTTITAIDATTALILGSAIAYRALPNTALSLTILASSLASVLPDLIEGPYFFLKIRSEKIKKWIAFQKSIQSDTTPFWGLLTQVITIAASLYWLFQHNRPF